MTPAQRVLLRRLNEGPYIRIDGTPLTFREELRHEEAGLMTWQEITAMAEAIRSRPGTPSSPLGWIDEHLLLTERQHTP